MFLDLQQKCQGNSLGLFTALQTIGGLNPSVDSEINYWVKKNIYILGKKEETQRMYVHGTKCFVKLTSDISAS